MTANEPTSFFAVRMPMPPPLNEQKIVSETTGRPILNKAHRTYKQKAARDVRHQLKLTPWIDLGGPLRITMRQHYGSQRSFDQSDWDGRVKILQDVVCRELGINDSRFTLAIVEKAGISEFDAFVDVEIMPR